MFATFPESGKMVGCASARYVAGSTQDELIPSICLKGVKCKCLSGSDKIADGGDGRVVRRTGIKRAR